MPRRNVIVLASLLGLAGLAGLLGLGVAQPPQPEKKADQVDTKVATSKLATTPAIDGLIIDDTYFVLSFPYLNTENRVYASKRFNPADIPAQTSDGILKKTQFYICPLPEIDYDALRKAYDERMVVGEFEPKVPGGKGKGVSIKQMSLTVPLVTDERRAAAADAINRLYGANVSAATNIALVPYREVRVSLATADGLQPVGLARDAEVRDHHIRIRLVGTDEELRQVVSDPRLECHFTSGGYQVQSNRLSVTLASFARLGYHHFLTGEADFKAWQKARSENNAAGLTLGPIAFGRTNVANTSATSGLKSAVTRDQVLQVTRDATQTLAIGQWTEFPAEAGELSSASEQLLTTLLGLAKEVKAEIKIDVSLARDKMIFHLLNTDLAPDVLTEVGQKLVAKNKREFNKEVDFTLTPPMGGGNGFKAGDKEKQDSEDNIEYDTKATLAGTRVSVPKSVKLYQFSNTKFDDLFVLSRSVTRATPYETGAPRPVSVLFTRRLPARQETRRLSDTIERRVGDKSNVLQLRQGHGKMDTSNTTTFIEFDVTSTLKDNRIEVAITYNLMNSDGVKYSGQETRTYNFASGERVLRIEGGPKFEFWYGYDFLKIPPGKNDKNEKAKAYASSVSLARTPDKNAYTRTDRNAGDKYEHAAKPLKPFEGNHVQNCTLYVDTDDHTGNMLKLRSQLGYDLSLDIPYVVELESVRMLRVDPLSEPPLPSLKK